MTRIHSVKTGELIALRSGAGRGDDAAAVPVRPERPWSLDGNSADLGNVVPFARPVAQSARTAPEVTLPPDAARTGAHVVHGHARLAAFLVLSLAAHGGLLAFLWREPDPLASIGLPVISVELVLGATAPAGVATKPGENETQAAAAPADPQPTEPAREAEQKATEQPQDIAVAKRDVAPEETTQLAPQPNETKPEPTSDPAPAVTVAPSPEPPKPIAPQPTQRNAAPKQVQRKADPKQRVAARPAETKATEPSRIAAPTRDRAGERARASAPANPANNLGVGRSDYDTNYRGLVAAHLARYKQYPADARSGGKGGTAAVTFTIGGSGAVASVGLARSSGVPSIDQEVVSMVRRASPFPAPPGGRPQSFTVPVNFSLR